MGQIIDLLTNLFKLTKVAAVTLPGLAAAGALALLFWLPPVDVIPIAEQTFLTPSPKVPYQIQQALPCPAVPGGDRRDCQIPSTAQDVPGMPACKVKQFVLSDLNDCDHCTHENKQEREEKAAKQKAEAGEKCPKKNDSKENSSNDDPRTLLCAAGIQPNRLLPYENADKAPGYISTAVGRQQYLLDYEKDAFAACAEVEDSWRGIEEQENTLLNADAANLDKQRSDVQDAYITYLKANNPGIPKLRAELQQILNEIEITREKILKNSSSIKERERRSSELKRDVGTITDRLADPGRLRPRKTFDDYLSGLVNHVVGFILLSLALSLVVTAIDRATFDSIYEVLFTNSRTMAAADASRQATDLGKFGLDGLFWATGLVLTIIFCAFLYCRSDYVPLKLITAAFACLTGIAFGHWLVGRQQNKGWSVVVHSFESSASQPSTRVDPKHIQDLGNLGFFNKRLALRDQRLLLPPSQLEKHYEKEQKRKAEQAEGKKLADGTPDSTIKTPPPQVLQPRYAIGKGIITQQEYQDLKDSYFAQSELSFGLILPIFLLVFALGKQQSQVCLPAWSFSVLVGIEILFTFCLFWAGMERQEKFGMEYRMLILGHWDKLNEATDQTKPAKPPKPDLGSLTKAVSDALKDMQMEVTPLVVQLKDQPAQPAAAAPAAPAPAPPAPKPAKPTSGSGAGDDK
jgi:hypothetical protein